jgi:Uma2 family endonuclease
MTAEEFYEWAKQTDWDSRFELIDGKPVERSLEGEWHGFVCGRVFRVVGDYMIDTGAGYACSNNAGLIVSRSPDTVLGPDVMAFREQISGVNDIAPGFATRPPALVVEVLAEDDRQADPSDRIRRFEKGGVPLIWVVHPSSRAVVEYWSEGPRLVRGAEMVDGHDILPGLKCRVNDLFEVAYER